MNEKRRALRNVSKNGDQSLGQVKREKLLSLPVEDAKAGAPPIKALSEKQRQTYEHAFDGVCAVAIPKPKSKEEEKQLVERFLAALQKLLTKEDNWTFLQQLILTLDACVQCQTCNDACAIYLASGKEEIYRPTYRSEVLRRIIKRYVKKGGNLFAALRGNDIELNWTTIARLAESAYRCTMCRRCATHCPMGSDNALITRELRKLFSEELGIAAKELHESGTVQQLRVGASTGITPPAFADIVEFMEDDIEEKTGRRIKIPVDKEGADILLIHNSGEYLSWLENPAAFAIIFDAAGISWTLSSELGGYEGTNYGVWYDDFQFGRIALKHIEIANKLKVKKIMIGECGHSTKATVVISERLLVGDMNIPRESCLPLLEELVLSGRLKLDPTRNNFPVTLHDPCNMVRLMGIIEPQRRILRAICPQFREMEPHGVDNYCCGGGSGFAVMSPMNFPDWKMNVSGRMKVKQILDAFADSMDPSIPKYVCAPCSNCKGQLRDLLVYYELTTRHGIYYGGLVELIVNAMADNKQPYISFEEM
ncbi:MAG TPA: (Fe-S)-binding protein [Syntrophorhabdales bacterium]|nr:(Fe-S)-binding protein [Syntrophorhabdales bacterium]